MHTRVPANLFRVRERKQRSRWSSSFQDFDGDNQVSLNDLIETVWRLAGTDEPGSNRLRGERNANGRCAFLLCVLDASTKDGIDKRLILFFFTESREAAFCCNKFPVAVAGSAVESRWIEKNCLLRGEINSVKLHSLSSKLGIVF